MAQQAAYAGTGRRKDSVARVRLVPGNGKITVNNKDVDQYIPFPNLVKDLKQPLTLTETEGQYDVLVNVNGGGFSGQAGAIRHGISLKNVKNEKCPQKDLEYGEKTENHGK